MISTSTWCRIALVLVSSVRPGEAAPPTNFQNQLVLTGVNSPMALEFLPDGRLLIVQRNGQILIADPQASPVTPANYLTIVNLSTVGDAGALGIALDPEFVTSNDFLYVTYVAESPFRLRVVRFTHTGNTADPGSEFQILKGPDISTAAHTAGSLQFGPDRRLYFTNGEQFDGALSQDLTHPGGSVLRVNTDGTIPADNLGMLDGVGGNADAIWAYGLRNPFNAYWDLSTGRYYIAENGGNDQATAWEDLHLGQAGVNFGWPNCEGPCANPDFPTCDCNLHDDPLFSYPHLGSGASIIGGVVYRGSQFPANPYFGAYFFADYVREWMRHLKFDNVGNVTPDSPVDFEPTAGRVLCMATGTDGALYYATLDGEVRRIAFNYGNQAPVITQASADPTLVLAGQNVNFTGAATDAESDPLAYQWNFGDGNSSAGQNASHAYAANGLYSAQLEVSDGSKTTTSAPVTISVGQLPDVSIDSPAEGSFFRAGDVINFTGSATDDGPIVETSFRWVIQFHHNAHIHPEQGPDIGSSTVLNIPLSGHDFHDDTKYEIILTYTDVDGLSGSTSIFILPDKANLSFDTVPSGLTVALDGIPRTTPFAHGCSSDSPLTPPKHPIYIR